MPSTETAVGVDACPLGWFVTVLSEAGVETKPYEDFSTVHEEYQEGRVFVDIPIGLPTRRRRHCDIRARDILGCRGASVFFPPCESAADIDDYDDANRDHEENIGYGLSQQAHAISDKINEIQSVVGDNLAGPIYESHPELCFHALNGQPVAYSKSSERGRTLRRHLLEERRAGLSDEYERVLRTTLRKNIRRDDILDSMALALAAQSEQLQTVPENPGPDTPRIHYPTTPALAESPWSEQ